MKRFYYGALLTVALSCGVRASQEVELGDSDPFGMRDLPEAVQQKPIFEFEPIISAGLAYYCSPGEIVAQLGRGLTDSYNKASQRCQAKCKQQYAQFWAYKNTYEFAKSSDSFDQTKKCLDECAKEEEKSKANE